MLLSFNILNPYFAGPNKVVKNTRYFTLFEYWCKRAVLLNWHRRTYSIAGVNRWVCFATVRGSITVSKLLDRVWLCLDSRSFGLALLVITISKSSSFNSIDLPQTTLKNNTVEIC